MTKAKELMAELMVIKAKVTQQYAFVDPEILDAITQEMCTRIIYIIQNKPEHLLDDSMLCPFCKTSCVDCFWATKYSNCGNEDSVYQIVTEIEAICLQLQESDDFKIWLYKVHDYNKKA